ncbi:MAG: hypothetical protein WBQ79_18575 [Acidobacteriaceae bacterium]
MRVGRLLWLFLLMFTVWALVMAWEASEYTTRPCAESGARHWACVLDRPIAELELAATPGELKASLDQGSAGQFEAWNLETARVNTCMDFLSIGLYWAVFVLFALECRRRLSRAVIGAISVAAIFDVLENVRLLQALRAISNSIAFISTPRDFSIAKWMALALAMVLLGIMLVRAQGWWRRVVSLLLMASAVVTIAGVFFVPLLALSGLVLLGALLIAIVLYMPLHPWKWKTALMWLEFSYLIRFQVIGGALLAIVLPAGYFAAPSIFVGIFDAQSFLSFAFVAYAALQLALIVMITTRLTQVYGPIRFAGIQGLPAAERVTWKVTGLFSLLALPVIVMACCGTEIPWWEKGIGVVAAQVLSLTVLWLIAKLHFYIEPMPGYTARMIFPDFPFLTTERRPHWSTGGWVHRLFVTMLPERLSLGVLRSEQEVRLEGGGTVGSLLSGHQLALAALCVQILTYVVIGIVSAPVTVDHAPAAPLFRLLMPLNEHQPAALFYLLFLLGLFTWFGSGAAFVLDVVRVPVITSSLAVSLLFGLLGTDHIFKVNGGDGHAAPRSPGEVIRAWEQKRGDATAPIVIVATSGGGIRAAAWTAEVLTGLTKECEVRPDESRFASSLVLVSAVSGGSEGAMYFAGSYDKDGRLPLATVANIRQAAYHSSLSSVGWGLLYPDLVRAVPGFGSVASPLFGNSVDRGWALEQDWLRHWTGRLWSTQPTLGEWSDDVEKGTRPAVIFNATAAESGQRFLMSSTTLPPDPRFERGYLPSIQFWNAFQGLDLRVATAARLSASFAWVSPMPRASTGENRFRVHVGDGGYYDNSGVVSAMEWLLAAGDAVKAHPLYVVLVDSTPGYPPAGENWTWQRQLVAPLETLQSVRTSSQQARSQFELQLATDFLVSKGFNVKPIRFRYPSDLLTPLSWHLTPEQQKNIGKAWSKPSADLIAQRDVLLRGLNCPLPPEEP